MIPLLAAVNFRTAAIGGLVLAAVVAAGYAAWRINSWKQDAEALPAVQEALQAERDCGEGSECLKRSLAAQAQAEAAAGVVLKGYEDELESLRNRPARVRTVRLCPATDSGDVRGAGPAAGTDGAGPATRELHGQAGPDLGPDLYELARDADEVAARLRALQQWNEALTGEP